MKPKYKIWDYLYTIQNNKAEKFRVEKINILELEWSYDDGPNDFEITYSKFNDKRWFNEKNCFLTKEELINIL